MKIKTLLVSKILNFLNKMDIGEISYATVKDFYEAGYLKSIPDIYKIENNVKSLSKLPGYGANKINKIINEIEKHRVVLPSVLLGSLGIEGVSIKTFKSFFIVVGRDGFEPSYPFENRFTVCRL